MTVRITVEMVETTCWCGLPMALPADLYGEAQRSGKAVYCPLGHTWVVKGSENDRLRRENALLVRQRDEAMADRDRAARALKRAKSRADRGICQHCQRSFVNVARHVAIKHPGA